MIVAETNLEEIPKCCGECPFFVFEVSDYGYCPLTEERMDIDEQLYRSHDCPLKEVPENAVT